MKLASEKFDWIVKIYYCAKIKNISGCEWDDAIYSVENFVWLKTCIKCGLLKLRIQRGNEF